MVVSDELSADLENVAEFLWHEGFAGESFFVTGATGLIGSLLLRSIARFNMKHEDQIRVYAQARDPEKVREIFGAEPGGFEFFYQDICDTIPDRIHPGYIVHTAGPTASKYLLEKPVESIHSICAGTMNVLAYARSTGVKSVVFLSSMEAFGQIHNCDRLHGETELGFIDLRNVRNCYPESKRLCEILCRAYAEEYGLNVVVARLAQVFGAGVSKNDGRVFAQFARSVIEGRDILLHTTGETVGNYCYTTDALRAVLLLLKKGAPGETYTIANEASTMTVRDMAELVSEKIACGRSKVVFDVPGEKHLGYPEPTKLRLSSEKIRALGWEPAVSMEEAYRRMIADLRL